MKARMLFEFISRRRKYRRMVANVSRILVSSDLTIAFGESATAGRLTYEFSLAHGAGKMLKGGIICYDQGVKKEVLGIPEWLIAEHTAESPEVTRAIVDGMKHLLPADIMVGITGLVRPGGSETPEKPVGTIFFSTFYDGRSKDHKILAEGSPEEIVEAAIIEVCRLVLSLLHKNG